ncbi:MAG TPA: thiamine diphosphokinase [Candidatus Limnocylindrales bacterium]|nr:thiamine diphosphokinase [Candidatus Limnocylindrales bacterium]
MTSGTSGGPPTRTRRAVILADGDSAGRAAIEAAWPGSLEGIDVVVAADGGARHAAALGLRIDRWVGDGDSLPPDALDRLRAAGTPIELSDHDKDESDTELAIRAAIRDGADDLIVLGAFGGARFDHAIANVALLADPILRGRTAVLLDAMARVRLVRAPGEDGGPVVARLDGRLGDLVTLLPFGVDAERIRTDGLRYPLRDETLHLGAARGLSNVRVSESASFKLGSGLLLVIETPVTLSI